MKIVDARKMKLFQHCCIDGPMIFFLTGKSCKHAVDTSVLSSDLVN